MQNIFDILKTYCTTIRTIQFDFMQGRLQARHMLRWQNIIVAKALHLLANTSVQLTEIEALYLGVQSLMAGDISHFILPREDSTLFLVMDVPITSDNLGLNFQLYDVIKLPIAIPEMHGYYSMLAIDITTIGSADVFIQMMDNRQPSTDIWHVSDVALTFLDRNRPTCARGLMEGNLSAIRATCRYRVHKSPYPRSVLRVHGNTFLLTNITQLRLHCTGQFDGEEQVLHLHGTQTLHQFDCHCD